MRVLSHGLPLWDIDQGEIRVDRTDSWTRGRKILLGKAIDLQHKSATRSLSVQGLVSDQAFSSSKMHVD